MLVRVTILCHHQCHQPYRLLYQCRVFHQEHPLAGRLLRIQEFIKICAYFANLERSTTSIKCLAAVYALGSSPAILSCRLVVDIYGFIFLFPRTHFTLFAQDTLLIEKFINCRDVIHGQ
jgi:hypothetical protein